MNKSAVIILILILLGGGYYAYMSFSSGTPTEIISLTDASTSDTTTAGAELIALLAQLQGIRLNDSIFNSPQFASLRDETTQVNQEPVGRNNPFAPIGHDNGFVPTADVTSTTKVTTNPNVISGSKPVDTASTTKKAR